MKANNKTNKNFTIKTVDVTQPKDQKFSLINNFFKVVQITVQFRENHRNLYILILSMVRLSDKTN